MGEPGGRRGRALSGARTWVTGRSYREYGVGLALAVLLASGAFGGLDDTRTEAPRVVPTATAVDVAPFRVTVERVRAGTDLGVSSIPQPEGRYLLVSLRVAVPDDEEGSVPWGVLRDLVRLEGARGLVGPYHSDGDPVPARPEEVVPTQLVSSDDAEGLGDLAPGLEYPVVVLFQQVDTEPVPDEVTVVLSAHRWRKDSIDQVEGWHDPAAAVRVTVPVAEFAPASPAPSPSPEPSS